MAFASLESAQSAFYLGLDGMEMWDISAVETNLTQVKSMLGAFEFEPGLLPLSKPIEPAVAVSLYILVIWAIKQVVAWRGSPFSVKSLVVVHNYMLASVSLVLGTCLALEIFNRIERNGIVETLVGGKLSDQRGILYFFYYINYILKYVELADTVLLALQAKPILFLHQYHHAATLVLCWVQLTAHTGVQWVVIIMNLFVHVAMYSYYALSSSFKNIWWKRYLTTIQILQFVVSVAVGIGTLVCRVLCDTGFNVPQPTGTYASATFGLAILVSYLALFIQLYKNIYPAAPANKKKTAKSL